MWRAAAVCGALAVAGATAGAQIPEQYPKPLIHTPADHPAARVLLVSVDGLHAYDLADFIAAHPLSTLAMLSKRGVTYTNAHSPWADPVAGLASLVTGGTPISTGILSSDGYDRSLAPAGSECKTKGARVALNALVLTKDAPLDPAHGCVPVLPHTLLRVNTIFEVVHNKIGPTAWAGHSFATADMMRGPSGQGLDRSCEGASDEARVTAVVRLIDGKGCDGAAGGAAPNLFGLSWTGVGAAQTQASWDGSPSEELTHAMETLDGALERMVVALKAAKLFDTTWIVVAGPWGGDGGPVARRVVAANEIASAMKPVAAANVAAGNLALIWLADPATTGAAVKALEAKATALGINDIYAGERLALTLNPPGAAYAPTAGASMAPDPRMPDIIVEPLPGVVYARPGERVASVRGGFSDRNTHVALLISGAQLTGRSDPTWVPTTQLGPLLLRALGMEKFDLDALHREHTPALPGIF